MARGLQLHGTKGATMFALAVLALSGLAGEPTTSTVSEPVWIRVAPTVLAPRRGRLEPPLPYAVTSQIPAGDGCDAPWQVLAGGGFACSTWSADTSDVPGPPPIVRFDPPTEDELADYLESNTYPRLPEGEDLGLPYVYARRSHGRTGRVYASLDAWRADEPPLRQLSDGALVAFPAVVRHGDQLGLERADGTVVPADDVVVLPGSRFEGRDLRLDPPVRGHAPAWVIAAGGASITDRPHGDVVGVMPWQSSLDVTGRGRWLQTATGGSVRADDLRVWTPGPLPDDVGVDTRWIDVDLSTQTLALMQGEHATFVTLVSTGVVGRDTPTGGFHVDDKELHTTMRSRPDSDDPYHVAHVPWVVDFLPRYALHGAFWHGGFGHPRSHGCINLSPRDARRVFYFVGPELPDGWHSIYVLEGEEAMLVRVRGRTPRKPEDRVEETIEPLPE